MSWRDNLYDASFRGIPFHVESSSTEVGRRNALHEYPFKDEPYVEDLGKAAGVYNVVGYVIQNAENDFDHFSERDDLITALETEGSGTLSHPFYGEIEVSLLGKARIDEQMNTGGGIARFQMVFVVSGASAFPIPDIDIASTIDALTGTTIASSISSFVDKYEAFSDGLNQAVSDVTSAVNMVNGTLYSIQAGIVSVISKVQTSIAQILNTIDTVVNFPDQLADAIKNTLATYETLLDDSVDGSSVSVNTSQVTSSVTNGITVTTTSTQIAATNNTLVNAILSLTKYGEAPDSADASKYGGTLEAIPATGTYNSEQKLINRKAIIQLVRIGAIAEASRVAVRIEYSSYDQAFAMMQKMIASVDDVLSYIDAENDELYSALQDLKPLLVSCLLSKGAALPPIVNYEVPADVTSSLAIAHRLYDDLDREQETIDRNPLDMIHPGFAPSGSTLEVSNE